MNTQASYFGVAVRNTHCMQVHTCQGEAVKEEESCPNKACTSSVDGLRRADALGRMSTKMENPSWGMREHKMEAVRRSEEKIKANVAQDQGCVHGRVFAFSSKSVLCLSPSRSLSLFW